MHKYIVVNVLGKARPPATIYPLDKHRALKSFQYDDRILMLHYGDVQAEYDVKLCTLFTDEHTYMYKLLQRDPVPAFERNMYILAFDVIVESGCHSTIVLLSTFLWVEHLCCMIC